MPRVVSGSGACAIGGETATDSILRLRHHFVACSYACANPSELRVFERPADEMNRQRQPGCTEARRDDDRRIAGDVGGLKPVGRRPRRQRWREARCRTGARRDQYIVATHERAHLGDHLRPHALRIYVVGAVHETCDQRSLEKHVSEVDGPRLERLPLYRERFRLFDERPHIVVLARRPQADLFELRAEILENPQRLGCGCAQFFIRGKVLLPEMPQHANRNVSEIRSQRSPQVFARGACAGRIVRIAGREHIEHERAVFDRLRERSARVQAVAVRNHAASAHQTERGFHSDESA